MSLTESPGLPQSVQNNEELQLQSLRVKTLASKVTRLLRGSGEASATSAISWFLHFICGISMFVALINPEQELALKFTLVKGGKTNKQKTKKPTRSAKQKPPERFFHPGFQCALTQHSVRFFHVFHPPCLEHYHLLD